MISAQQARERYNNDNEKAVEFWEKNKDLIFSKIEADCSTQESTWFYFEETIDKKSCQYITMQLTDLGYKVEWHEGEYGPYGGWIWW